MSFLDTTVPATALPCVRRGDGGQTRDVPRVEGPVQADVRARDVLGERGGRDPA